MPAALAVFVVLTVAGCGGDDDETAPTTAPTGEQAGATGGGEETGTQAGGGEAGGGEAGGGEAGGGEAGGGEARSEGERGEEGPTGREAIERNVAAVISGGDPEVVCDELATERFVRSAYGAPEGCNDAVAAQRAVDVRVVGVAIDGSSARATAIPLDGPSEGERLKAELVLEDGVWKLDSLRSNAPVGP
jgi:hypothetical protein